MSSGRGLCDELITRPEEYYRLCCVVVCDLETSRIGADISSLKIKLNCRWYGEPFVTADKIYQQLSLYFIQGINFAVENLVHFLLKISPCAQPL